MLSKLTVAEQFNKSVHVIVAKADRNLTALDRKVFNILLANAYSSLQKRQIHKIRIADITAMLLGDEGSDAVVRDSLNRLFEQNVSIEYVDEDGIHHTVRCHYLSFKLSDMSTPQLTYAFDPMLLTFLVDPKIYAIIRLDVSRRLRSVEAIKLYEMTQMIRYRFNATKEMTVEEVRELLEVGDRHTRLNHFKERVVEPAVKEVSAVADFRIEVDYVKEGRGGKVDRMVFRVAPKIAGAGPDDSPSHSRRSGPLDDRQIELFTGSTAAERSVPPVVSEQARRTARSILGPEVDVELLIDEWFADVGERSHLKPDESFLSFAHIRAASRTPEFVDQEVDVEALYADMMKKGNA